MVSYISDQPRNGGIGGGRRRTGHGRMPAPISMGTLAVSSVGIHETVADSTFSFFFFVIHLQLFTESLSDRSLELFIISPSFCGSGA